MLKPPLRDREHGRVVYVVGPVRLQNDLMASSIKETTGAQCVTLSHLGELPPLGNGCGASVLVLWDCHGKDDASCLLELESHHSKVGDYPRIGLFNVGSTHGLEQQAVYDGIQGFFYEQDSFEMIARGVSAMFEGELWVPRRVMAECIIRNNHRQAFPEKKPIPLTLREQEILKLIARGVTNDEIADMLCISRHTVKTHLYNIFKKIDVPNRLQAALWAAKNL